jgi:hypothetical protein
MSIKLRLLKLEQKRAIGDTRLTFIWSEEPELIAIARWQKDNRKPLPKRCVFIGWQQ